MKRKSLFLICIIFLMLFALTGCKNDEQSIPVQKGLSEIRFLENQTITIFNKYFEDEYLLEDGNADWNLFNEDFGVLRESLDVILIDFAGIQIPSQSIVDLQNYFVDVDNLISSNNIDLVMKKVCDIYNLVSYSILDNISESEEIKLEKKAKSDLIYVGYYLKTGNKEFALSNIDVFKENYSKLSANKNYVENNSYKVNKIFMNTQNLQQEINNENFENGMLIFSKILKNF